MLKQLLDPQRVRMSPIQFLATALAPLLGVEALRSEILFFKGLGIAVLILFVVICAWSAVIQPWTRKVLQ